MNNILNQVVHTATSSGREWSDRQIAGFDAAQKCDDNLLFEAVAGSGKTTMLCELTRYVAGPVRFLAFAKANALDLKGKLPVGEAQTINSFGHRMWMENRPGTRLDADKLEKLLHSRLPEKLRREFGYSIKRLVSAAKQNGYAVDHKAEVSAFSDFISNADWLDIEDSMIPDVAEWACRLFEESRNDLTTFDFDDQIYVPVYQNWKFPKLGTILLDEAQDLNTLQHIFVERLAAAGARIVAVGDRHQSIYAFRGALHDSMDLLKHHFQMLELPLDITYRCPQSVVREAQVYVPQIKARPGAPEGEVLYRARQLEEAWKGAENEREMDEREFRDPEFWPEGHLIICRNNAPLFSAVMRSVRARKPCRVMSNALDGLQSFIRKFRANDVDHLIVKLDAWLEKETEAAMMKGLPWKVAALEDKVATVKALSIGMDSVEQILFVLRQLSEGRSGPLFATVHKAKGLEADHVYFLRPDLVPAPWVLKKENNREALQQELNIRYVGITRAKQTLTYGLEEKK